MTRTPGKVLEAQEEDSRPRKRPRKKWVDRLKEDIQYTVQNLVVVFRKNCGKLD